MSYRTHKKKILPVGEGNTPARVVLSFNLKDILSRLVQKSDFLSTKEELNL